MTFEISFIFKNKMFSVFVRKLDDLNIIAFRLGRSFLRRLNAKHSSLTMKRQGTISMNRALNCTRNMATDHLDKFKLKTCIIIYKFGNLDWISFEILS